MRLRPANWASWVPTGLGHTKPSHFRSMAKVAWRNRDQLPYAWRILRDGVCDGCALGTSGLRDWTMEGTHLCMVRLELLRLNTASPFDPKLLEDTSRLESLSSGELRELGRLPAPMIRRKGDSGFRVISWEEALALVSGRIGSSNPERLAFYLTSRGIPNETYYMAQKVARFLGSPHVDNSARLCHAASTVAMKRAFGHGASTGSYSDWIGADLIVFFGSNVANNQPVTTKYLYYAKKRGTEVAVVNPYREPGMKRYWVPSVAESALFGTEITDHWFQVHTGGDLAFLNGVLKALLELPGGIDREYIGSFVDGFEQVEASLATQSWSELEAAGGLDRSEMERFARLLIDKPNAILVWSMGLTQHEHGADTVQAVCNLGLARGLLGRGKRGLTPIRGHSGVQGGAEVGCVPVDDAAVLDRWQEVWGFDPPRTPGMATMAQIEASGKGDLDVFWIVGGNFLETVPDRERSRQALARPGLRVHQDIVLSSSMLVEPSDEVVLLPTCTRYEIPGGVTETSTERRVIFSPEIPGPRVDQARPEWEVLQEVARRARPERASSMEVTDLAQVREEISRAVPLYRGIETLAGKGDQFQWGGATLFADGNFATPNGRARMVPVAPPTSIRASSDAPAELRLSTRRGRQFNSMVHATRDPLNGARREDVLLSRRDASRLNLKDGDSVRLSSEAGEYSGRVRIAPIKPGNVEVHWPEAMTLLPVRIDPSSGEPDYGTMVSIRRGEGDRAQ